jgi:uncharacterized membrane-anchored protein YjiN (DUF445 family)
MKKIDNQTRYLAGAKAVQEHVKDIEIKRNFTLLAKMHEDDREDAIVDTIADILHYANNAGVKHSIAYISRLALQHVIDECEQEGKE